MSSKDVDSLLAKAERELEESIAALNDLWEHNFVYLFPKESKNGKGNSSQPQTIDVTKMVQLSDNEQSKLTSKMNEILPKLSKARRTIARDYALLKNEKKDGNESDNDNENENENEFDNLFEEADDAYNTTRTPHASIFSMESGGYQAERRFTDLLHRASVAFENYEKSQYNDDNSKKQFETLIKNANEQLKQAKSGKASMDETNMDANGNNSNNKNENNGEAIFDQFDSLLKQADVMFDKGNENNIDNARVGIKQSLAIINQQLKYVSQNNEKILAKDKQNQKQKQDSQKQESQQQNDDQKENSN